MKNQPAPHWKTSGSGEPAQRVPSPGQHAVTLAWSRAPWHGLLPPICLLCGATGDGPRSVRRLRRRPAAQYGPVELRPAAGGRFPMATANIAEHGLSASIAPLPVLLSTTGGFLILGLKFTHRLSPPGCWASCSRRRWPNGTRRRPIVSFRYRCIRYACGNAGSIRRWNWRDQRPTFSACRCWQIGLRRVRHTPANPTGCQPSPPNLREAFAANGNLYRDGGWR